MPVIAVAVTGGVIAGTQIPSAQASPVLPVKTPGQLLALVNQDQKVPPLTGTVVETTSLGLPQLPQAGNPTSLSSLLTGSHTIKVYYLNAQHFRLSVQQPMSETDVIRSANTLWLWESAGNSVTEYTAPAGTHPNAGKKLPATPVLTPQQAANEILAAVGKTTLVSVQDNVTVANEPAYQLVLKPKDHRSLVGRVVIAVDAKYGVPLKVQVFAKGDGGPAFQVGYTQLSMNQVPAAANLNFTAPPGAKVDKVNVGAKPALSAATPKQKQDMTGFATYGSDWLTVVSLPQQDLLSSLGTGAPGSNAPAAPSAGPGGLGGDSQKVIGALLGAAKPVSGNWGQGTLLQTGLFSMLMTGGEVYIGAVQPSVLYAAVGHTS